MKPDARRSVAPPLLALDVGGANLKIADGAGFAASVPFPLWKMPERLAAALAELIGRAPPAERFVATMTGELADCYETKAQGVHAIVTALAEATAGHELRSSSNGWHVRGPRNGHRPAFGGRGFELACGGSIRGAIRCVGRWAFVRRRQHDV